MLAELSLLEVVFQLIGANDAAVVVLERIFDDVRALVADFAELGYLVDGVRLLPARQLHHVRQALLEVMDAEGHVLCLVVDHI